MELFDTTARALEQAIRGASLRQTTLADNLANANTPGFRRSDVDFGSTLAQAMRSGDPRDAVERASFAAAPDGSGALRLDGNNVDVDAESARLSQNGLIYQTLVAVARGRADVLRSAMGVH